MFSKKQKVFLYLQKENYQERWMINTAISKRLKDNISNIAWDWKQDVQHVT